MRIPLHPIGSDISSNQPNRESTSEKEELLLERREVVHQGWGQKYIDRVHKKGKMTTQERISYLIDEGTSYFEVGTLVNWGREFGKKKAPGAGVFTGFCQIDGKWTMVIANDNTVASGSWWPKTPEKIQRAQEMSLRLKIPVIYLVDCSGLYLPEQSLSFPGKTGAGHIFKKNAELSSAGVPQIAGVFGDCIAGGGYMPIISDRVFMTEQAYMVIAGAALIKGAKSLELTSLDIGGPEVHVHQSGCADERVPNDQVCLDKIKEEIKKLPSSAVPYYQFSSSASEPMVQPDELYSLFPTEHRHIYNSREVLARLVDSSLFYEFMPHVGKEICVGIGRVGGLWMGFAINVLEPQPHPYKSGYRAGGILYKEGIAKLSSFSRACNDDGIPLVWLQDIAGFDIGVEAEALGLLGYGSSLIYANSTNKIPMYTVLLRKASGAGYYAMAGLPYEPIVQLSTVNTRLSVMEGRTLAIAAYNTKLDDDYEIITQDPEERKQIEEGMKATENRIEKDMDPVKSADQMDVDEIICLSELRPWIKTLAEMSYQSIGRRVKNPRIWSIHDLHVLSQYGATQSSQKDSEISGTSDTQNANNENIEALQDGEFFIRSTMDGSFWSRPSPDKAPFLSKDAVGEKGQNIALIEVMKTFIPLTLAQDAKLVEWYKSDGDAVGTDEIIGRFVQI